MNSAAPPHLATRPPRLAPTRADLLAKLRSSRRQASPPEAARAAGARMKVKAPCRRRPPGVRRARGRGPHCWMGRQSRNSLAMRIAGGASTLSSSMSPIHVGAAPVSERAALGFPQRRARLHQPDLAGGVEAPARRVARRTSAIRVPSPGPSSIRRTGDGAPSRAQISPAHRPTSSPNICETCGAVMKSPSAPTWGWAA